MKILKEEDLRELIKQRQSKNVNMVQWNNTSLFKWEYDLLCEIEAINYKGILKNYPILKVIIKSKDGDKERLEDYSADIDEIMEKAAIINSDSKDKFAASLIYISRNYNLYKEVHEKMQNEYAEKKYAEKINTPVYSD